MTKTLFDSLQKRAVRFTPSVNGVYPALRGRSDGIEKRFFRILLEECVEYP